MMEAAGSSETSVLFSQNPRRKTTPSLFLLPLSDSTVYTGRQECKTKFRPTASAHRERYSEFPELLHTTAHTNTQNTRPVPPLPTPPS